MLNWRPSILTLAFPSFFIFYFFDWLLPQWSVTHLSLCKISVSQLCSVKWLKIAFELWGGGYGQIWPGRAFPVALIPKWHSNMLVICPRPSPNLSPLLRLQMFVFVQSDLLDGTWYKNCLCQFLWNCLYKLLFSRPLGLSMPSSWVCSLPVFICQQYNLNILLKSCQSHL